jgi:asparaginyl-tRNA synthetase
MKIEGTIMDKKTTHHIRALYQAFTTTENDLDGSEVKLSGWIRTNRNNGAVGFIELNDGSYFKNAQLVYQQALSDFDMMTKLGTGTAISVTGKLVKTSTNKQPFELQVLGIIVVGSAPESYPLQKKRHGFDFLREIAHLRPRTNTFTALFRLRSILSMAIHQFFQDRDFVYVHTPIITGNDAEGAGQIFHCIVDPKAPEAFFQKPASLTVSGQLHVEAFALAFKDVYTFGPTFRAEPSNTSRHASEFWMIEPEITFADLQDDMVLIEDCIKYCIQYVLEKCPEEIAFFNQFIDTQLLQRLQSVLTSSFQRMTYTEAIVRLQQAVQGSLKFEKSKITWGMDLQTEHERYLSETIAKGPIFVTDYPKDIKAFYMRLNDDGKTVAACDLLVPGVGELVGGSQREERYALLEKRMIEQGNKEGLQWYLDLRLYGGAPHAGFGIGFDRLLMYLTGMNNIRDVQPYPRTPGSLLY